MSAERDVKTSRKGCTRELFLRTEFTDPQERLHGMAKVCYELLKITAKNEVKRRCSSVRSFDEKEHKDAISDIQIQLYIFLRSLLEQEKERSTSKTLNRVLASPESLRIEWNQKRQNRLIGSKKAETPENLDEVYKQRWRYYRHQLVGVLRDRERRVDTRDMHGWEEHYFSYGSKELPVLRMDQFMERIDAFVSVFKPSLKDEDFWRGEEILYRKDGTEGCREGPGADKLDQFCLEFWKRAAKFFGQEHVLQLSMVMETLPRLYTYFCRPKELSLNDEPEEDQDGEKKPQLDLPDEVSVFDTEERAVDVLADQKENIVAAVRTLCPRDRKLILMGMTPLSDVEKARRLGHRSSSWIPEQTKNAFRKILEVCKLPSRPSPDYLEALIAICEAVWPDEKKELEAFGPMEK